MQAFKASIALLFFSLGSAASTFDAWNGMIQLNQRIETIQSLCKTMKNNYAGWELKKHITLGEGYLINPQDSRSKNVVADGDFICDEAVATERKITDPATSHRLAIAQHNLAFGDRIRLFSARFKDSHFAIQRIQSRTLIRTGFKLFEHQGRFYISSVEPYLRKYLERTRQTVIKKGDQVLFWNSKPVDHSLKKVLPYTYASSELAQKTDALDLLTERSFSYPARKDVKLSTKDTNTNKISIVDIPWVYGSAHLNGGKATHRDDFLVLKSVGALEYAASVLSLTGEKVQGEEDHFYQAEDEARISLEGNLSDVTKLYDSEKELIAQKGIFEDRILWIQIRTFIDWTVAEVNPSRDKLRSELKDYLNHWITHADVRNLKVVLDLRYNNGGQAGLAKALVSYFLTSGQLAYPTTEAMVMTDSNRSTLYQAFDPEFGMNRSGSEQSVYEPGFASRFLKKIEAERERKWFISPLFREKRISTSSNLKNPLPLVIWTGPGCVSSCEDAVSILMMNKLGVTLGRPTNGTGMGQHSTSLFWTTMTLNDTYQVFGAYFMPNFFFGPPSVIEGMGLDPENDLRRRIKRISENRPSGVDIVYDESLDDLNKNGLGWLRTSHAVFKKMKKAK